MNRPLETPEQVTRRCGDRMERDIRETVARIYAPQAGDAVTLVAIALFVATVALLAQLVVN